MGSRSRQPDREAGAVPGALPASASAVGGHDGLHDGEAETAATDGSVPVPTRRVGAPEPVEHLGGLVAQSPGPSSVTSTSASPSRRRRRPRPAWRRRVVAGVREQVGEHLTEPRVVTFDHHRAYGGELTARSGSTARASLTASAATVVRSTGGVERPALIQPRQQQ